MKEQRKSVFRGGLWQPVLAAGCLFAVALIVVACSSGSKSTTTSGMATVNVSLSDPATCAAPDGPYSHVWVTITDVQANVSSTAGDNDSSWVDLTPSLSKAPKQIDLLGQANNQCFLAMLGDNQQLQAGTYEQIRLILADNSLSVSGNACGSSANCIFLTSDGSTPHALQLSSEAKTGLKIPSGQIASGGFTIAAGQTKDLNIDFNTCESIVKEGNNGQYRLKPVLHAGEVSTTSSSINGKVLDMATGNPMSGSVEVALEQKDTAGIDRVIMSTMAAADGTFVFCPIPQGTYDVVIVGATSAGTLYEPAIITGVATGSAVGTVNLNPPTTALAAVSAANLAGQVSSQSSTTTGIAVDVTLTALEAVNSVSYTIPLPITSTQSAASVSVETAAPSSTLTCPQNTFCANYTLQVPSGGAFIGAWSASGATLAQPAPLATYTVDGMAFSTSTGLADCSSPDLQSTPPSVLSGVGPFSVPVPTIPFTTCQ